MKIIKNTYLLIIIMLCLVWLVCKIFYMREGMDTALSILNQDTNGNCIYDEQGVTDLNSLDGILLPGINDEVKIDGYKQACNNQSNQVMCERIHASSHNGKKVINYCDWDFSEE